jgi:hypothetical protein
MYDFNKIISDTIILTFTDKNYLDIFKIFYSYFNKLNLSNLLVISLDEYTYNYLTQKNIRTILIKYYINSKDSFWKFRLNTINDIFNISNKNIIHTDSDCFWMKDIFNLINNYSYDFIGSIECGHPHELSNKYGFNICCGFYYIKYNENMVNMMKNIISQEGYGIDDQVLFNYYMFNNMKQIIENPSENICKEIILNNSSIKFGILSENIVSREKYRESLHCFHPFLSEKVTSCKIIQIKNFFKNYKNYYSIIPKKKKIYKYLFY